MRLFLSEQGLPYEVNLGDTAVGLVLSPEECKHFWKTMKKCAKHGRPYFTGTVPDSSDSTTKLEALMAYLMEKVGYKRPERINLDQMKVQRINMTQKKKDDPEGK